MPAITCVIPFYNEGNRLTHTLSQLQLVPAIDHFILIDDGSTQPHPQIPLPNNRFTLLQLTPNQGKTTAVKTAIPHIKSSYTLLFDADLHHFDPQQLQQHLSNLIPLKPDMVIFRQSTDPWYCKLSGFDLCYSGERLVRTHHLRSLVPQLKNNYSLELDLNSYFLNSSHVVGWIPFNSQNYKKIQKWPLSTSLKKSWSLYTQLLTPSRLHQYWQAYHSFQSRKIL
jgi:glycosyltransferase involved in cell wall biosynthesis